MRQVGIGGYTDSKKSNLSELFPGIEEKINNIEMDISELSRKVRLEKESYTAIYNTIKDNSQRLTSIPSIRPLNGGYLNTGIGYRKDPFTGENSIIPGQLQLWNSDNMQLIDSIEFGDYTGPWHIKNCPINNTVYVKQPLNKKDLFIDHDWNTYNISGLPPTPICNVGVSAFDAVLNPEKNYYLYFVADGKGGHIFSETYQEHLNNIKKVYKK